MSDKWHFSNVVGYHFFLIIYYTLLIYIQNITIIIYDYAVK